MKAKNQLNIEKHVLDVEFTKQLFNTDLLVTSDNRFDYTESYYIRYGRIDDTFYIGTDDLSAFLSCSVITTLKVVFIIEN